MVHPGVVLHPQLLGSFSFGPISAGGLEGLLGSDQLQRYDWVMFDYAAGAWSSGSGSLYSGPENPSMSVTP